jgi:predicted Zn-ribbon and HTH transcriptional regulator
MSTRIAEMNARIEELYKAGQDDQARQLETIANAEARRIMYRLLPVPPCECGWEFADRAEADDGCPACRVGISVRDDRAFCHLCGEVDGHTENCRDDPRKDVTR